MVPKRYIDYVSQLNLSLDHISPRLRHDSDSLTPGAHKERRRNGTIEDQ
jgi:hypothetical protein